MKVKILLPSQLYYTNIIFLGKPRLLQISRQWPLDPIVFGIVGSSSREQKQPKRSYNIPQRVVYAITVRKVAWVLLLPRTHPLTHYSAFLNLQLVRGMIYMGNLVLKLDCACIFLGSPSSATRVCCGKWLGCTRPQDTRVVHNRKFADIIP